MYMEVIYLEKPDWDDLCWQYYGGGGGSLIRIHVCRFRTKNLSLCMLCVVVYRICYDCVTDKLVC